MRKLLLLFLLFATIAKAQTTLVSGTVTDLGGQTWNNGTYSFTTQALGQLAITGLLSSTGTFTNVSIPHTPATGRVGDVWVLTVCPQLGVTAGCYPTTITIVQQTQTINPTPAAISISIPTQPVTVPPIGAYADNEITGGFVGYSYYNLTLSSYRICTSISGGICAWATPPSGNATNLVGPGSISGTFSGNRTETGNITQQGSINCKDFEGIKCVDNTNSQGWAGADPCAWITSAQSALPSTGGFIYAYSLTGTCAAALTIGASSKPVSLYFLGVTTLTVNGQISTGYQGSHIFGIASQTTITQGGSFPASTPVLFIGVSSGITDSTIESIIVNCNSVANSIGAKNTWGLDRSGFRYILTQNCFTHGVWFDGTQTGNAQNSIGEYLWTLSPTSGSPGSGIYANSVNQLRGTSWTAASNGSFIIPIQIQIDGGNVKVQDVHIENGTIGVDIGPVTATILELSSIDGASNVATAVRIENTAGNRATVRHIIANGSTNTVIDSLVSGLTITDSFIPEYDTWNTSAYWRKANGTTMVIGTGAQILGPDGTIGAPGFAFNSQTNQNTGWSKPGTNYWKFSSNSLDSFSIGPAIGLLGSGTTWAWTNGDSFSGTTDTGLSRISAGVVGVGTGANGNVAGTLQSGKYQTGTNCAVNSVSPAACGSSAAGAFVIPTTTTTYTVNTSAVTANSVIVITPRTYTGNLPSTPTCVVPTITAEPVVSAISAGVSFTLTETSTTGQTCWNYWIVN